MIWGAQLQYAPRGAGYVTYFCGTVLAFGGIFLALGEQAMIWGARLQNTPMAPGMSSYINA